MENCTIYSHYPDFDKVISIVKSLLPKSKIKTTNHGLHRSMEVTIRSGLFKSGKKLTINSRQRETPSINLERINCDMSNNLAGMAGFVQNIDAQNKEMQSLLLNKIKTMNIEMPFMADPGFDEDFLPVLKRISEEMDCIVFAQPGGSIGKSTQQHFLDKNMDLILDLEGNSGIEQLEVHVNSEFYDSPRDEYKTDQLERKEQSEQFLKEHGIKVNENLPCVASKEIVTLRSVEDVVDRAYALMVIAAKGEGVEQEYLKKAVKQKKIKSFSPNELEIYEAKELSDQQRANAAWRYEALNVLMWALGKSEVLNYPSEICNVEEVIAPIFHPERAEFETSVRLRSAEEILNELDKTYRMHWACVDARIKGMEPAGGIHGGIVFERHYALNWLTNYRDQAWDEVTTDT